MPPLLQISPGLLLTIGVLAIGLLTGLFWPGNGLIDRLRRTRRNTERVLLEDALKFMFDCAYKNLPCGLNSIAGNLHISTDRAAKLMERLGELGLATLQTQSFALTDAGRSYALRIIRIHRIWEKYLAEETGADPLEWHGAADDKEHQLTSEAAEALAARIGNPVFDPHGDPIPTATGELPALAGVPLRALKPGEIARIVHIEDEPKAVYQQLVAMGLYPGMQVYLLEKRDEKIVFAADGAECILAPLFAESITVEHLPEHAPMRAPHNVLAELKLGESATIAGISPNCRGQQRRRLMDLGIVPGARISAEIESASGDPVGYRILGATIGIRKSQAELIFITKKVTN
jgi:DtxR family Mn-dependent transcriptional regulator